MTEASTTADRRAQTVCATGLIIQLALFGVVLAVGMWNGSDAIVAGARHLLGGVLVWLSLLIVFTQRKRSHLENLESEQLQRAQAAGLGTQIFDVQDEALLLERRRLNWTYKFILPAATVLLAAYHIGGTFVAWGWPIQRGILHPDWSRASMPFVAMLFMAGSAFVCFVYARYVIGMGRRSEWRMLRAGGSYLLGNALTLSVLIVATAFAGHTAAAVWAEPLAAYIIRAVLLLLGLELVVNFILEFYRPRQADEEVTPAFDSRVLALFSEPGGIARSIADTMNYQFGFEVSGTWFYQLLRRSIFPLAMLTVVILIGMSAVVIVDADQQVIIERFGAPVQADGETLGAGIHLKYPWPIDRVERTRVALIQEFIIGHSEEEDEQDGQDEHFDFEHPILWTEQHGFNQETMLLVADRDAAIDLDVSGPTVAAGDAGGERSVAVSLLMVSMVIEYRVNDLHAYKYRYRDPIRVLEAVAHQELSDYAAGADLTALMGKGRIAFARDMKNVLQARIDQLDLGIVVAFVALQDAHPPAENDVAGTFQNVVSAEIRKSAAIAAAEGRADRILSETVGNVERAQALDRAIQEMERLTAESKPLGTPEAEEAAAAAVKTVNDLLLGNAAKGIAPCSGLVAVTIATARAERYRNVSNAAGKSRTFANDLLAYQTAPEIFQTRRYLEVLQRVLAPLRKFILTMDPESSNVIIEYVTQKQTTLDLEAPGPG
ncbi:MAG: hypothetical protein IID39_00565 [Planctomycetes bacterium]|nr:hypothetical protein [Planctomycetota bacterium]